MYFLIASGLSLIYGLMGVLNFAHGAFLTVGAYATWWRARAARRDRIGRAALLRGRGARARRGRGASAALVELVLIRPLYQRHIEQVLVTVGLSLALIALVQGDLGPDRAHLPGAEAGSYETTRSSARAIPNDRFVEILVRGRSCWSG